MKITKGSLQQIIKEEIKKIQEDEFSGVRVQSQAKAKGEIAGSADAKQIQNLTQRVFQIENSFKKIGGVEQIVKLTRRVFALEQAAKG